LLLLASVLHNLRTTHPHTAVMERLAMERLAIIERLAMFCKTDDAMVFIPK
jgi:hypothetical protein